MITEFVQALPKAELHLHLEGALPWQLIQSRSNGDVPALPPWWADEFRFPDFRDFLEVMRLGTLYALQSLPDYHQAARLVFQQLAAQNVRYVEISFSPEKVNAHQLPLAEVAAAIKSAVPPGLTVSLFCGLSRTTPYQTQDELVQEVLACAALDGIDLHGDEREGHPGDFADIFAEARRHGLRVKAHAGELLGPESVWATLDHLQVPRIEHGTTAIYDEGLLERLAAESITLDLCLTSNLKLRVVDQIAVHPIREFHRRGIQVTVNTDDPTVFHCDLTGELRLLAAQLDFSVHDLAQLQKNAFAVADLTEVKRQRIFDEIDAVVRQYT